jgi:CRP-like cAMP-binding protein
MYSILKSHILSRVRLTEDEFNTAANYFTPKKIRRRQYLLQAGDVCRYLAFVSKGGLRSYSVDDKGEEHILQFAVEDWWIADMKSFLTNQPAIYNIDAFEDSELLLIDKKAQDKLCGLIPQFEHYFRILLESSTSAAQMRISDFISSSAEDRYLNFLKMYPQLAQRVPQSQIASYLGITPQSLSRIRREISENK